VCFKWGVFCLSVLGCLFFGFFLLASFFVWEVFFFFFFFCFFSLFFSFFFLFFFFFYYSFFPVLSSGFLLRQELNRSHPSFISSPATFPSSFDSSESLRRVPLNCSVEGKAVPCFSCLPGVVVFALISAPLFFSSLSASSLLTVGRLCSNLFLREGSSFSYPLLCLRI